MRRDLHDDRSAAPDPEFGASGSQVATTRFGPSESQATAAFDRPATSDDRGTTPEGTAGVERATADAATEEATRPTAALPSLESELYLLAPDATGPCARREATRSALGTLALDTALTAGGDAVWIDSHGYVATHALARLAPQRALERVRVARAFTLHQHHALVTGVARWLHEGEPGPFGGPGTARPAVLIVPAVDATYRAGEPSATRRERLFARTVAQLQGVARRADVPVVVTLAETGGLGDAIRAAATRIDLAATQFGPRFDCDALSFETVAYDEGATVQTTFAFWREVLASRHAVGEPNAPRTEVEA